MRFPQFKVSSLFASVLKPHIILSFGTALSLGSACLAQGVTLPSSIDPSIARDRACADEFESKTEHAGIRAEIVDGRAVFKREGANGKLEKVTKGERSRYLATFTACRNLADENRRGDASQKKICKESFKDLKKAGDEFASACNKARLPKGKDGFACSEQINKCNECYVGGVCEELDETPEYVNKMVNLAVQKPESNFATRIFGQEPVDASEKYEARVDKATQDAEKRYQKYKSCPVMARAGLKEAKDERDERTKKLQDLQEARTDLQAKMLKANTDKQKAQADIQHELGELSRQEGDVRRSFESNMEQIKSSLADRLFKLEDEIVQLEDQKSEGLIAHDEAMAAMSDGEAQVYEACEGQATDLLNTYRQRKLDKMMAGKNTKQSLAHATRSLGVNDSEKRFKAYYAKCMQRAQKRLRSIAKRRANANKAVQKRLARLDARIAKNRRAAQKIEIHDFPMQQQNAAREYRSKMESIAVQKAQKNADLQKALQDHQTNTQHYNQQIALLDQKLQQAEMAKNELMTDVAMREQIGGIGSIDEGDDSLIEAQTKYESFAGMVSVYDVDDCATAMPDRCKDAAAYLGISGADCTEEKVRRAVTSSEAGQ